MTEILKSWVILFCVAKGFWVSFLPPHQSPLPWSELCSIPGCPCFLNIPWHSQLSFTVSVRRSQAVHCYFVWKVVSLLLKKSAQTFFKVKWRTSLKNKASKCTNPRDSLPPQLPVLQLKIRRKMSQDNVSHVLCLSPPQDQEHHQPERHKGTGNMFNGQKTTRATHSQVAKLHPNERIKKF